MIAVECHTDEFLVNALGFRNVRHCTGKGDVLRFLEKNQVSIGIIDEDPGKSQPASLKRYSEVERKESVTVLKDCQNNGSIILVLSPDLEGWLLKRAKAQGINMRSFRLPDTQEGLHAPHIEKRRNFQEFVRHLLEIDEEAHYLREKILAHSSSQTR
jgi:hypothetical protein